MHLIFFSLVHFVFYVFNGVLFVVVVSVIFIVVCLTVYLFGFVSYCHGIRDAMNICVDNGS